MFIPPHHRNPGLSSHLTGIAHVQYDHEEMQELLGRSFAVDSAVDDDELLGELDLIEDELALEGPQAAGAGAVPAFLEEPALPAAPQGAAAYGADAEPMRMGANAT